MVPSYITDKELIEIRDKSKATIDALSPILGFTRVSGLLYWNVFDPLMKQTTDPLDRLLNFALEAHDAILQEMTLRGLSHE